MSRTGLQHLSTSARNSPFGSEKIALDNKSKGPIETLKLATVKKYQPLIPSPLVTSPFNVFSTDNKENVETQTAEHHTVSTQTNVTVPQEQPRITAEDLTAEHPTSNYLRVLADSLQMDLEDEMKRSDELVEELYQLDEQLRKVKDDTQILLEVLADIESEQNADEVGIIHL